MAVFIGCFALIFGMMPSDFFINQEEYSPVSGQDPYIADYFTANNVTLYKSTWGFNLTFAYGDVMEVLADIPATDHQIEFHAQTDIYGETVLHVRHAYPSWFFGLWLESHYLEMLPSDFAQSGGSHANLITWSMIENLEIDVNASAFEMRCEHVSMSFVVMNTGDYATLEDSWNNDEITVLSSYEIDFDAMKPSAFTLIAQLITFQSPDFGIPGDLGTILNYIFAVGFWIIVAVMIYTIITRLVPTIQGGIEN